jgi:hypothetical protein
MSRLIGRKLLMSRGSGAVRIVCARFYRPLPRRVKSDRLLDRNIYFGGCGIFWAVARIFMVCQRVWHRQRLRDAADCRALGIPI